MFAGSPLVINSFNKCQLKSFYDSLQDQDFASCSQENQSFSSFEFQFSLESLKHVSVSAAEKDVFPTRISPNLTIPICLIHMSLQNSCQSSSGKSFGTYI
jgi:hypothetical protein